MYNKILEIALAVLLVLGAWWYSGHTAVENYKQVQALEQAKADKAQQARYDELAGKYETLRDMRDSNARTIVREVEKVVDRPVYRNVCIDDSGLRLINKALAGESASIADAEVQTAE